ncbi:MAG: DUF115 domain-containing protein [Treponema sp.]|nr:DUF115 domain-containing protein [Treponema sp.]
MNSIWNSNRELFTARFPALADMLKEEMEGFERKLAEGSPLPLSVEPAKNGSPTASENGTMLHSKYSPDREAAQQAGSFNADEEQSAIFFSCGLGYTAIALCKNRPDVPVVIIEEKAEYIFQALSVLDWAPVLTHPAISLLIGADTDSVAGILRQYDLKKAHVFAVPAQGVHSAEYFKQIRLLMEQDKRKDDTNTATLEKFARLWLSNTCRNIKQLDRLDGINRYLGKGTGIPFIVLAAGPSLDRVLPYLARLKERAVIVCVDTALRSCLHVGVEPDFIVLVDPQYACAMHLEFLAAPSSILITEVAAWPSVFRFECREKVLCSSMYPPGQYFEKKLGWKGRLGAGGSVATTAWDFARFCGATEIFLAGMDLGFPGRQTHIRGSQFEEREHRISSRLYPSESQSTAALLSDAPIILKDYAGNELLSDKKMSLFSWWFEKNCTLAKEQGVKTYSLTAESLAIEGIESFPLDEFLKREEKRAEKEAFFAPASKAGPEGDSRENGPSPQFEDVLSSFIGDMERMKDMAAKGISLCDKAIVNRLKAPEVFAELSRLDSAILRSESKEAAALVFPTERKLKELTKGLPEDKTLHSLYYSRIIYRELKKACQDYTEFLSSFSTLPR